MPLRRSASVAEGAGLSQRLLRFKASSGLGEEGGHWKDAWLVLHRDGILRWYNDHQCSRLLGESSVRDYPRRLKLGAAASEDGAFLPPCPIATPQAEEEGTILAIPGWSYSRPTVWFWLPDPATIRSWLHALSAALFKLRVYHLYLKQHEATGEPIQWDVLWQQILDFDRDDLGELSASRISLRDDFVLVDAEGEPLSGAVEARPRRLRERKRRRRMRPSRSLSPSRAPDSATPNSNSNLSIAASAPLADIASTPTSHGSSRHSVHSSTHSIHSSTHSHHSGAHSGAGSRSQSPSPARRPLSIEVSAEVHHWEYSPKSPSIATPASLGARSAHSAVSGSLTEESFVRSPSGEVFLAKTNGEEEEEPPELLFQISLAEEEKKTAGNLYRESFKDENRPAVEIREERWTETVIPQQTGAPMSDSDMLAEVAAAMAGPKKVDTADSFADALGTRAAQTREERGLSAILAETRAQQAAEVEEAHPEAEEVEEAPLEEAADGAEVRAGIGAGLVVGETNKRDLRVLVAEDPAKQTLRSSRVFRYKRGRRLSGGGHWKEGWLVLHGDGNLAWYNDRQCSVLVGRTNLIEYPRRLKIGPQAALSEDVKGSVPKPPGDDPNRLICIPAWTGSGSPTWLYLRDDLDIEDWLGSFATVLGKKSVYDRLLHEAKQAQPSPHQSRSHLPQKEEEEGKGKGKGQQWALLWADVIDYGNETTMRRRKRRTKGAQRAPTPSRHSPERRSSRPHSRASSSAPVEEENKPETKTYESGLKEEEVLLNGQVETGKEEAPTVEDWEIVDALEEQPPDEHPIIHTTASLLQTRGEEEENREKEKEAKDRAEEAEDMAALVSKVEKAQEETAARRSAFFASEDSTRTSSLSPPLDEHSENSSNSMESLVLVDGVRLTKAEALRRRLEESREMAIRSKLPYPPLSVKLNGHIAESSETPGTPPSSPQPQDSDQPPPLPKSQAPNHLQQSEAEKTEHTTTTSVTIISTSTGESQDEAKTEAAVTRAPVETKHEEASPKDDEKMEKAEETSPASLEQHHSQPQSLQSEKVTVRTLDIATHPSTTTTTTTTTTTSAHVKEEKKAVEEMENPKEEQSFVEVKVVGASPQIVEDKPKSAKPYSPTNSEEIARVKTREQVPSPSPSALKESTEHVESDSGKGIQEHHIVHVVKEQKHEEVKLAEPAKEAKPATASPVKESTEHVPEEPKIRVERKEEKKVVGEKKGVAVEVRPIQAAVETRALDSDSESGQVGMQSTDAESEEEDREFIAKALAARRRSTPVKLTLPPSDEKEDSDGEEEEEATTPRGGSPQPPQGPPQPQLPPPQPSQPVRPPPPSVRLTDYRRGPLERLTTSTTTTTERHSVVVGSGELEVRRVNLVQSNSSSGGGEATAMSGRHASVEALATAQTEHRVGELERVLSEARAELEKNQRLREALERERLRLRDAARQAQSQAYLQARQRQLQAIFDRAQQEAAALIHSDQSFNSLP